MQYFSRPTPPGGETEAGDPVDPGHEIDDEEKNKIKLDLKSG